MSKQQLVLPSGGAIAGVPGDYAPGVYLVDYDARTAEPDTSATTQLSSDPVDLSSNQQTPDLATEVQQLQQEVQLLAVAQQIQHP